MYIPSTNQNAALENNNNNFRKVLTDKTSHSLFYLGKSMREDKATGIILPAYDYDRINDVDFKKSHSPYRVPGEASPFEGWESHDNLSLWWMPLLTYSFVRPTNDTWISPSSRKVMCDPATLSKEDTVDLFFETYMHVKMEVKGGRMTKAEGDRLTTSPNKEESSIIPRQEEKVVVQTFVSDEKDNTEGKIGFLVLGRGAWTQLVADLHKDLPRSVQNVTDPDFENYLLGDITNPQRALQFGCDMISVPHMKQPMNALVFGGKENDPSKFKHVPISDELLNSRIHMHDDSIWNFPTMEEQIEFLVNQAPEIPYDHIQAACSKYIAVPSRTNTTISTPSGSPSTAASGTPGAPSAPSAPQASQFVAPEKEEEFTCAEPGGSVSKLSKSEVVKNPALMVHLNGAWVTQAEAGLTPTPKAEEVAPPAPGLPQAGPPVNGADAQATQNTTDSATTATPTTSPSSPTGGLTPEELQEWETLKTRMKASGGDGPNLSEAETARITDLVGKGASVG